jgi:hypothetical protein
MVIANPSFFQVPYMLTRPADWDQSPKQSPGKKVEGLFVQRLNWSEQFVILFCFTYNHRARYPNPEFFSCSSS